MRILLPFLLLASGVVHAETCDINLKANDAMKFDQRTVTVDHTCKTITINLVHTGMLPAKTMGHNVVITSSVALQAVAQAGAKAGLTGNFVPPNDPRVIAFTTIIGGGEKTSVSFPGIKLKAGDAYSFFCSAPGHWTLMRGQLVVK